MNTLLMLFTHNAGTDKSPTVYSHKFKSRRSWLYCCLWWLHWRILLRRLRKDAERRGGQ